MAGGHRILIVDDESSVCKFIGRYLQSQGFKTATGSNGLEALSQCASFQPELLLLDIRMPKMDGMEALKRVKKAYPDIEVVMVTAVGDIKTALKCIKYGAFGYLLKPANIDDLGVEIGKALEHRRLVLETRDYQANLEKKVEERTAEVRRLHQDLKESFLNTVTITTGLIEAHDPFLGGHSVRVAKISQDLGSDLKLSPKELMDLKLAALLHEIGKIAIPDPIRDRPFSELNRDEIAVIKKYPVFSQKILSSSRELSRPGEIIRHHLEHVDGTGFPDGVPGDEIPLESRVLGTANAYDELMTRRRFTREKFPNEKIKAEFAIEALKKLAGKFYDKGMVAILEKATEETYRTALKTKKLASAADLAPGMITAADIKTKDGRLLLAEGNVMSSIQVLKIQALNSARLLGGELYVHDAR